MQEYRDNAQAPDGTECRAEGPNEQRGEHDAKGEAAFGSPLQPVVVGLVGERPYIDDGVVGIDGGPSAETRAEPRVRGDHVEGGHGELAAHRQWRSEERRVGK